MASSSALSPTGYSYLEEEDEEDEEVLLEQLEELHRQLAAVRDDESSSSHHIGGGDNTTFLPTVHENFSSSSSAPPPVINEGNKIIVVSMGKYIRMEKTMDDEWQYFPSQGGFKDAIESLRPSNDIQWVSWPGIVVDEASQEGVSNKLENEYQCKPVFLSNDTVELYYHKFCNVNLWSLMHCLPHQSDTGLLDSFLEQYDAYCTANQKFLEAVSEVYNDGDLVLVCDYPLMNLPALLRRRYPDIVCGFFMHCPFPSSEFFRMLPVRQSLLHGMLGADLVVFNHFDYVRHFLNVCTRMLGLESSPSRIEYNGRLVSLGICPLGINPSKFEITEDVTIKVDVLRKRFKDYKVIVSVDKLDFCKGVPEKLAAMEYLLTHFPEYRETIVLVVLVRNVGGTSSSEYRQLNQQINEMVGRVNGSFGTATYCPIVYLKTSIDSDQLTALYNIGDVMLVSSLKEGINLQALEYVASQTKPNVGVLIYSDFAGCAASLKGALTVNPFDSEQVARSIDNALCMSTTTKQIRHHQLVRYVKTYTASLWAQRILKTITEADATSRAYKVLDKLESTQLFSLYERSQRRLFLLDYDGTLMPYQSMSQLASPSSAILSCLEALVADPKNAVYVVSGRSRDCLQKWFESIPELGLAAENGYWLRPAAFEESDLEVGDPLLQSSAWQCHEHHNVLDIKWREDVESLLEHFTARTPGSLLEVKDTSFTWHFHDADPDFGLHQAKDLQLHLDQMLRQCPVGVVMAPLKKYIVVRPARLSKARGVTNIIGCEAASSAKQQMTSVFDFIFAIGDERTDEDMFDVVRGNNAFTCTVGRKVSRADYYVDDTEEVLRVLTALTMIKGHEQDNE